MTDKTKERILKRTESIPAFLVLQVLEAVEIELFIEENEEVDNVQQSLQ